MSTTISIDDRLAQQVRRAAEARGMSINAFIAETLGDVVKSRGEASEPPPFQLVTVRGARIRPEIDLDRPRALEAHDDRTRFEHGTR